MAGNWYNESWKRRSPVAVSALGGGGSAGTVDVEIDIPKDWDEFWDSIRSDMFDVVAVSKTGGLLNFSRKAGANYATRTLTIQVDTLAISNDDAISYIYIYYDNSSASDQAVATTISSPKAGNIFVGAPTGRIVQSLANRSATDAPQSTFSKATIEEVNVWFSVGSLLMGRFATYNQRKLFEGIDYVQIRSLDASGTDDAGRYDEGETRFINGWVMARSKGGANNTDYTLEALIVTTTNQKFSLRALIQVRDLLPS